MDKSLSSVECATISVEDIPSATPAGVGDIGSGRRSGGRQKAATHRLIWSDPVNLAYRVVEVFLLFPLMSFVILFGYEPGGESRSASRDDHHADMRGLVTARQSNRSELPLSTCVDHVPKHAPE